MSENMDIEKHSSDIMIEDAMIEDAVIEDDTETIDLEEETDQLSYIWNRCSSLSMRS